MGRLHYKDIGIAYAGATVASVSTAAVGGLVWSELGGNVNYNLLIGSTWLLTVGVPSTLVAAETLRRTLGEKRDATVAAIGGSNKSNRRRAIPYSAGRKSGHVFLSSLPIIGDQFVDAVGKRDIETPTIFTATIDDNNYSVTADEIESFLRNGWKRQRGGENALSRAYWTRQHRPRLKPLEYYARLNVLLSCPGLVLDRGERRSGRLGLSPGLAIKTLEAKFGLA